MGNANTGGNVNLSIGLLEKTEREPPDVVLINLVKGNIAFSLTIILALCIQYSSCEGLFLLSDSPATLIVIQ